MSVLAAPLHSMGMIGTRNFSLNLEIARMLIPPLGFVLLGIPVYYVTQRKEDMPTVFGAYRDRVDSF